ncbi:putative oxidoreductase [Brevirhabdus pacifica]|uniref:DoxX family protein n=1 Tax=Brevirhabdus pacifica TaxID=1267768 RepID=UPI0009F92162|nr:DoxX family membrane protein [Brevirhabdus pacifica]PJJ85121.1 putative oxidoreductase [Brevirhabdus pacifica]
MGNPATFSRPEATTPGPRAAYADAAVLLGRILLGLLFLGGALQKTGDPGPAMLLLAERGLPESLVWPATAFNLVTGLALVVGWRVRVVALLLAAYCAATSIFHLKPEDPWQMTIFVKNWAIAGGLLALYAHGGGRFALDARARPGR